MPKEFYTERDIEDLFQRGIRSLQITENVVLTELAYEKANRLGLQLVSQDGERPPTGPVRPYLSQAEPPHPKPAADAVARPQPQAQAASPRASDVEQRIRSAVIAKLGDQVDVKLLDNIIQRVVKGVGLK